MSIHYSKTAKNQGTKPTSIQNCKNVNNDTPNGHLPLNVFDKTFRCHIGT
jgi:hypothetical protein